MTLEIPVNVNTTLNQKRLPVIPGFSSLYAYKRDRHLAISDNYFTIQMHKKKADVEFVYRHLICTF